MNWFGWKVRIPSPFKAQGWRPSSWIYLYSINFFSAKIIKTFEVNVFAHFWTLKAFLPGMIEAKKGHIVNIASMAGYGGINKLVDYCASKFADIGKV